MGPDLELKGRSEIIMEALTNKENGSVLEEPEAKPMKCESNYEDYTFEMEAQLDKQTEEAHRIEDVEVNIMECTNSGQNALVEAECQDATENSSSFSDTVSGVENGAMLGDAEVVSQLRSDTTSAVEFDGFGEMFRMRKKRLTSHWRNFIQPLMWRCKWAELQIKRFQCQAIKYDTEIAEKTQRKQFELENFNLEDFGAKSLPFSGHSQRQKVMKRKKRKRVEDTEDTAAYMSHHNLFSYYENRRSTADAALADDWGNLVISADKNITGNDEFAVTDELLSLEFRDGNDSLEQIYRKIGVVQSQVSELKTRLEKVMSENAGKFSTTDKLSLLVPCNDALTSSARIPASPPNNGDRMAVGTSYIASRLMPEYNTGDLVILESAVSSHGEGTHLPDIIESTDQHQVGGVRKNTEDGILIYNRRAKEELNKDGILIYNRRAKEDMNNFGEVKIQPIEKLRLPKQEQGSTIPPVPGLEDLPTDDQPPPKIRSISKLTAPKNTRKRGRRKASSGRWSRKSSG